MEVGSLSGNRNLLLALWIIVVLGLGGAFYMYYYQPTQKQVQELETIVEKKKREVREIEMTKRLLAEVNQEIERLKVDIARLEKFFPEEVFIPRVLVLIENLAEATHITIDSIKPVSGASRSSSAPSSAAAQPAPAAAPAAAAAAAAKPGVLVFDAEKEYKTMDVDFKAKGTFQNIYNFMNELTTFPKLVVVNTISLSPLSTGGTNTEDKTETEQREIEVGESIELSADMPLTFYIQKQKAPEALAGGAAQPGAAR
jgi:Tfp pilus assembly protein PilO